MASFCIRSCRGFWGQRRLYLTRNLLPYMSVNNISTSESAKNMVSVARYQHNCLAKHLNRINIAYRSFHTTFSVMKKFKESDYEKLLIFDPSGEYMCTAEMAVLNKFCHLFHRFAFQEMENTGKKVGEADNQNLRAFQIIDKKAKEMSDRTEMKEKKTKEVKFHKDASAGPKLIKILEILVDHGKINISFDETGGKVEKEVRKVLDEFATFRTLPRDRGALYFANMKDVDSKIVQKLFSMIHEQEADHIAEVRRFLLDNTKDRHDKKL